MLSRRRRFYDHDAYPELEAVRADHATILAEARTSIAALDHHMIEASYILPMVAEAEDRSEVADKIWAQVRALSPRTTALVGSIPYVVAYAYSTLAPHKHIAEHEHWNPYLVAILCLDDGGGSYLIVGGERRDFVDGEITLFDYTLPHEVQNLGDRDRIVLLMVIDPRLAKAQPASQDQAADRPST